MPSCDGVGHGHSVLYHEQLAVHTIDAWWCERTFCGGIHVLHRFTALGLLNWMLVLRYIVVSVDVLPIVVKLDGCAS